jgi:glutamyl-tRNA reductase
MANEKAWETRIRGAAAQVEAEVQKVIQYINDEVVPDVRKNGSEALRMAAQELQRLAERMDDSKTPPPPASR